MNQNQSGANQKSFLIRDLLRDLMVKSTENDETSDDSGNYLDMYKNANVFLIESNEGLKAFVVKIHLTLVN